MVLVTFYGGDVFLPMYEISSWWVQFRSVYTP